MVFSVKPPAGQREVVVFSSNTPRTFPNTPSSSCQNMKSSAAKPRRISYSDSCWRGYLGRSKGYLIEMSKPDRARTSQAEYYCLSLPCRRFYSLYYDPPSPKWKPAFRGRYFFLTSDASMAISEGCSSESLSDSSSPSVPSSLNQCPHHLTEQLLPPFCLTAALTKNWLEQLKYDQ